MNPLTLRFTAKFAAAMHHGHPRPTCEGSRALVAAGCVHDGRAWCPTCHGEVDAEPALPRVVRLRVHRTEVRS